MTSRLYVFGQPRPDPISWGMGSVLRDADGSTGNNKVTAGDLAKIEKILSNKKTQTRKSAPSGSILKPPTLPGSSFLP